MSENVQQQLPVEPLSWFSAPTAQTAGVQRPGEGGEGDQPSRRRADKEKGAGVSKANDRLTLSLAREAADLNSALYLRYEMPDASVGMAAAGKAAGVKYNNHSAEMKKLEKESHSVDHKLRGPSHAHVARACIMPGCSKQFAEGAPPDHVKLRDKMKEFYTNEIFAKGITAQKLGRVIPYFRVQVLKATDGEKPKAIISCHFHRDLNIGLALSRQLEALMEFEGGVYLAGAAPRGPLERKLAEEVGPREKQ
ncbi:unnamed protein product [Prorocentrum cordatum]|uniref:Uncharacterized protein n=1 Tax=Prorocentrum cordatum TaxID=2364126 RepID=A0ABN9SVM4_9DINO|nr:unnamed protein product [Polarella glacialis]